MSSTTAASSTARPAAGAPTAGPAPWHRPVLALDAVGCLAIGAVLAAAPAGLVAGFAATTATPVRLAGAVFLLAALVNGLAARTEGRGATFLAVALDDVAVVGSVVVLLTAGDLEAWARGLLVAGIVVSLAFGLLKLRGLRRSAGGRAGR